MTPTKKLPLYIVTGASGVGKTTLCEELFRRETEYIVMESDLLWEERYNTPENNYAPYRSLWMRVCANISQIGKPVVLCGCALPEQFEFRPERELFSEIRYLAVVCKEECLLKRMREGRGIQEESWIESSLAFNRWLQEHAEETNPPINLLDTTCLTPKEAAERAEKWIGQK